MRIKTDLKIVSVFEAVIGAPLFYGAATLLRIHLNDSLGILSYGVLLIPALIVHLLVVCMFVTVELDGRD